MSVKATQPEKQVRLGLLLSGMMIGISFITMLVPLALYHVAQVAATLRLRTTYLLLAAVICSTLFFGLALGQELFVLGGLVGAFWAPLFAIAIYQRKKNKRVLLSVLLFFVPVFFVLFAAFRAPQIEDLEKYLEARKEVVVADLHASNEATANEFSATWDKSFERLKSSREFLVASEVARYNPWQRIAWLTFSPYAAYFFIFGLVLNALASLVFLDHAFDQIEKLKAAVRYVLGKRELFSRDLVEQFSRFPLLENNEGDDAAVTVKSYGRQNPSSDDVRLSKRLLLPKRSADKLYLGDYVFHLDRRQSRWRLGSFALPFWLVFLSIAALGVLVFQHRGAEALITAASGENGAVVATVGLGAVIILCVLAVQGMLALYQRLMPLLLMIVVLLVIVVGLALPMDPFVILTVFGTVGLLDYAYDFRGRLEKRGESS